MRRITKQMKKWGGKFGKEYTDRNVFTSDELDELYREKYGVSRTKLNRLFIGELNLNIRILEAGSNVGNQLLSLQNTGFKNLYGIEINNYALKLAKARTKNVDIIQGSALDIPFKSGCFDLVFTSGLLVHINPKDIKKALEDIFRCSRKFIWGFEYYADRYTEVVYRGNKELLWKTNFSKLYLDTFNDLVLIKEKRLKYLDNENIDTMFLLKKMIG